jgi:hypothetical protein
MTEIGSNAMSIWPDSTEVQLARVGLGVGDEFGDGAGRKMRCDCEHERNA